MFDYSNIRRMNQPLHRFKAEFFKALARPTRLVILEHLRSGEKCVQDLQQSIGCEQAHISQHLSVLRTKHIVDGRKAGTTVYYRVRDPLIFELLDVARAIFTNQLTSTKDLLLELQDTS